MTHPARDIVRFKSEHFAPVLPEDCQVNPGVYGAELAFWLSAELARSGVATSYPNPEDWGWFIEFLPDSGSEFAVHCGNEEGVRDRWLLSLRRLSLISRRAVSSRIVGSIGLRRYSLAARLV